VRFNQLSERIKDNPAYTFLARSRRRAARGFRAYLLRRRRARAARKRGQSRKTTYVLLIGLAILLGLFVTALSYISPDPHGRRLTIDQLSALADQERIDTARFLDADHIIEGTFSAPPKADATVEPAPKKEAKSDKKGVSKGSGSTAAASSEPETPAVVEPESPIGSAAKAPAGSGDYYVSYPSSDVVTSILVTMTTKAGATVAVDPQSTKQLVRLIATFLLPLMILANLFALLFSASKGAGSGIGEVMMFGSIGSKARRKKGAGAPITFAQVAGADEAVAELREVRDYLEDPERYEEIGATPPKGVLLFGPPGCGKTLLAKAVAGEAGVPFFSVAGAEFVESLVGVGAARVRDLFARVRAVAPAIVFIDELDAAGRKRGSGGSSGGSDEREQTLNQMLVEMDGFDVSQGVVVIGATNRPDILDPALLRPGRFDRHITVEQPDIGGRQQILELHAGGKPVSPTVDFTYLARRTPGFSGADLANVINEAALLTVREGKDEIEMPELEEAIQRVLAGPKKRGRILSPEERKRAAYHESGHAVVAAASGRLEQVHRVSILARGRGLGVASIQRESDAVLFTESQLFSELVTAMGGRAAEQLVFGEGSTSQEQDLQQATDLARDMIGRFGMGTRSRRLLSKESDGFLGSELGVVHVSAKVHQEMEDEIDDLLARSEAEATRLLAQHRSALDQLATRLESEETLEGPDLDSVLALVRPEVTLFGGLLDEPSGNGHVHLDIQEEDA
jgi:cell division protease FtsH